MKKLLVGIGLVVLCTAIFLISNRSQFLKSSGSDGFSVVFSISKSAPSDLPAQLCLSLRDINEKTPGKVDSMVSEDKKYIYLRINAYYENDISEFDLLKSVDHSIDNLGMDKYVEYVVINENGLAQSTSGFNPDIFP